MYSKNLRVEVQVKVNVIAIVWVISNKVPPFSLLTAAALIILSVTHVMLIEVDEKITSWNRNFQLQLSLRVRLPLRTSLSLRVSLVVA